HPADFRQFHLMALDSDRALLVVRGIRSTTILLGLEARLAEMLAVIPKVTVGLIEVHLGIGKG
uniref:hypothetical protein n=1 Tax=Eshraghiella crossota TaxID=45851 RepID=UPI004025F876